MGRTILTCAIMLLAPPLLLYALAQAGAFHSAVNGYALLAAAWATGIAALPTSGWPRDAQLMVGLAYTLAAIPVLPLLALLAVCTTGDCI